MTTTLQTITQTGSTTASAAVIQSSGAPAKSEHEKFTFSDLLDVINPLQHIPVVGTIYRELTGDSISPAARIAGDTLYGGVLGFAGSIVDSLVEGETGKDIGSHIMATVFGDDDDAAKTASAQPATSASSGQNVAGATVASGATLPAALAAMTAPAASPAVTPAAPMVAAGPTNYFQTLQTGGHTHKAVPLNATIPVPQPNRASVTAQPSNPTPAAALSSGPIMNSVASDQPAANTPTSLLPGAVAQPQISSAIPQTSTATASNVPTAALPDMMMKALDKYRTLENQRSSTMGQTAGVALIN